MLEITNRGFPCNTIETNISPLGLIDKLNLADDRFETDKSEKKNKERFKLSFSLPPILEMEIYKIFNVLSLLSLAQTLEAPMCRSIH